MRLRFGFALLVVMAVLPLNRSNADMISYGNFTGDSVSFFGVTENTLMPGLPPYGAPTVSGNEMVFDMLGLVRQADGDPCTPFPVMSFMNGHLSMNVQADPGNVLQSVEIRIGGSHSVFGPDSFARANLTADARDSVSGNLVSGMALFQSAPTIGFDVNDGPWSATLTLLLDSVSAVDFDLNSQLMAFAGTAGYGNGFINADFLSIKFNASIVAVPEPGSAFMLVGGFGFLFTRNRRRRFERARSTVASYENSPTWIRWFRIG